MKSRLICVVVLALSLLICCGSAGAQSAAKAATGKTSSTVQKPPQPGMVWANTKSKVYHKEGDQWYGKGKNGKWMTEADAKKAGYRASSAGAAAPAKKTP